MNPALEGGKKIAFGLACQWSSCSDAFKGSLEPPGNVS